MIRCLKRIVLVVCETTSVSKCNRKVDRSVESLTEEKCSVEMCDGNPKILRQALEILSYNVCRIDIFCVKIISKITT